jgi:hypothetical protein
LLLLTIECHSTVYTFYDTDEGKLIHKKIKAGDTGYIDPRYKDRSFAEAKLAEIIPLCWEYDPDKRIDIFHLVELLRAAVKENKSHEAVKNQLPEKKVETVVKPRKKAD